MTKQEAKRDYEFRLPSAFDERCASCVSCVRKRCDHLQIEIDNPNRSACPHYYPYALTFGSDHR